MESLRLPRSEYRLQRMREYAALELRREPSIYIGDDLRVCTEEDPPLYEFTYLNRHYPCTAQHFQLRHLVSSPAVGSVFFTYGSTLMEWDPVANIEYAQLNFREVAGPHTRITAICATEEYLLVGGFYGELVVKRAALNVDEGHGAEEYGRQLIRMTHDENGITNQIRPFHSSTPNKFLISSNDAHVRVFDAELHKVTDLYRAEMAVNVRNLITQFKLYLFILHLGRQQRSLQMDD